MKRKNTQLKTLEEVYKDLDLSEIEKDYIKAEAKYLKLLSKFRETRKGLGLTQAELAARSEIPRETIARIETGKQNATVETLITLANAMGKSLEVSLR